MDSNVRSREAFTSSNANMCTKYSEQQRQNEWQQNEWIYFLTIIRIELRKSLFFIYIHQCGAYVLCSAKAKCLSNSVTIVHIIRIVYRTGSRIHFHWLSHKIGNIFASVYSVWVFLFRVFRSQYNEPYIVQISE